MRSILTMILNRAKERSTWMGLVTLATALGVTMNPEQREAVATLGIAVAGVVAVFTKDTK